MCELGADGSQQAAPVKVPDLPQAIAEYEQAGGAGLRWVWASTAQLYPGLLRAGVRVSRCHDIALAEALLDGRDRAARETAARGSAAAASAARENATGQGPAWEPVLAGGGGQGALFESADRAPRDPRAGA